MVRPIASFIAILRYLFILASLALAVLAFASLFRGILELARLIAGAGLEMKPGSGAEVVPYFIRAAFMYFLAVSLYSLFVADIPVPQWMVVRNLLQFRAKILTFVSIILPLAFMGRLMTVDQSAPAVLYTGAGIFLVLMGIFFLVRYGSPSGDEGMSREGNRTPETRTDSSRAQGDKRKDRAQGAGRRAQKDRTEQGDWLKKQKEDLKFQKDSLEKAVDRDLSEGTRTRQGSNVTVRPGPRRPRGRR